HPDRRAMADCDHPRQWRGFLERIAWHRYAGQGGQRAGIAWRAARLFRAELYSLCLAAWSGAARGGAGADRQHAQGPAPALPLQLVCAVLAALRTDPDQIAA